MGTIVEGRIRATIVVGKEATPAVPWWLLLLLLLEKESPPAVFFLLLLLSSLLMLETSYTGRSLVAVVGRNLPRQVLFGEPAAAGSAAVVIRSNTSSSLVVVVGRNCLGGAVVVVSGRLEETTPSLPNYTISSLKFHRQFLIELGPEKIPWLLLRTTGSLLRLQPPQQHRRYHSLPRRFGIVTFGPCGLLLPVVSFPHSLGVFGGYICSFSSWGVSDSSDTPKTNPITTLQEDATISDTATWPELEKDGARDNDGTATNPFPAAKESPLPLGDPTRTEDTLRRADQAHAWPPKPPPLATPPPPLTTHQQKRQQAHSRERSII